MGKVYESVSGWRDCGNGMEGKAENGEKIILLINGTAYNLEPSLEGSDASTQIRYADDNRLQFVDGDQTTAYMWGMIEQCGFSSFCMQNLGIFALENGKTQSTKGGGRMLSSLKKDSIAKSIGAVPSQVQLIMNSFELTQLKLNNKKCYLGVRSISNKLHSSNMLGKM